MPKFDSEIDVSDLAGKVVLVTGGNAGIGAALVRALAAHNPACLYLCARRRSSAEEVIASIHTQHPKANIEFLELDLNTFDSVKKCAAEFNQRSDRLDLLFLNAGVSSTAPSLTKEGYEQQFGINHMGHALLTQLLMPKMLSTTRNVNGGAKPDVRIVVTSSIGGHVFQPKTGLALDQMKTPAESLSSITRYGHSKLANILFAKKLAQLYPNITSTSHHPGTVKSEIWGKADGYGFWGKLMTPIVALTGITTEQGAKPGLWTATAALGKGGVENGVFYGSTGAKKEDNKNAGDAGLRDELWRWTNQELAKHGAPGWPEA